LNTPRRPMTPDDATPEPSAGERLRDHWRGEAERWSAVSAHLPVGGDGRLGAALGLSRKVARYLLRWYINPIVEQQNHFNAALLSLDALHEARERELLREISDLRERIAALEQQRAAPDRTP
jgi:hypothetical protein